MTNKEMKLRYIPKKAIREELGGGFIYRCCWLNCNNVVKSDWRFCAYCGQRIAFEDDDYINDYYGDIL